MKKVFYFLGLIIASAAIIYACQKAPVNENQPEAIHKAKPAECTTIQDGILLYAPGHYLAGQPLETGYDIYGYNYQAHMFNGSYANVYIGRNGFPPYEGDTDAYLADNPTFDPNDLVTHWYWPYRDEDLVMKWNDAWLSNKDCDGDGKLDRHYGFTTYVGSGAWETNHNWGTYIGEDGEECNWNYFVKIIAVPADAEKLAGIWYTADGTEIGPDIWGQFAIIQEVWNDHCAGVHGIYYSSPDHNGFGGW